MKIGLAVRPGTGSRKKVRTGQSKKSQGCNISAIWGEAPSASIENKICMVGQLADVITCAKFQDDIFTGYEFTGGLISHFPIDFCMGLTTVQSDCAACDGYLYSPGRTISNKKTNLIKRNTNTDKNTKHVN